MLAEIRALRRANPRPKEKQKGTFRPCRRPPLRRRFSAALNPNFHPALTPVSVFSVSEPPSSAFGGFHMTSSTRCREVICPRSITGGQPPPRLPTSWRVSVSSQGRFPPGGRVGSEVSSSGQTSSLANHVCERRIKGKFSCHGGNGADLFVSSFFCFLTFT